MDSKNKVEVTLQVIPQGETLSKEGIDYSGAAFVNLWVDGVDILTTGEFEGTVVVWDELVKAANGPGNYLVFTGTSGVADAAGWQAVAVAHDEGQVSMSFSRDGNDYRFNFDSAEFKEAIQNAATKIEALDEGIKVEPQFVVAPE